MFSIAGSVVGLQCNLRVSFSTLGSPDRETGVNHTRATCARESVWKGFLK